MLIVAIALIVVGAGLSLLGAQRLTASRRRVLAPGEVGPGNGLPFLIAGDVALVAGILLIVL